MQANRIRSPAYPNMSLKDAIDAVRKIEIQYRSSPVDRELAVKLIGYSTLSGPASKALAALASFGLVERAGKGTMRVTTQARSILHAENKEERKEALLLAAMQPQLFQNIRDRFQDILVPPADGVKNLLNKMGFNSNAIEPAAKAFLETMQFIEEQGAAKSHGLNIDESIESEDIIVNFGGARVGDLVQWKNFEEPQRVRWISDDGVWLAVEGSDKAIPMNETIVESSNLLMSRPPIPPQVLSAVQLPQDGFSEWFRVKVGTDKLITINYKGVDEIGPKEIEKIINILQAQKIALEE